MAADAAEQRAGRYLLTASPPHPDHPGFRHYYEDSAYGGAASADFTNPAFAGTSGTSDYSTGSETDHYGQYLECPQAFDLPVSSPEVVPLATDVKAEESDGDDVIYIETVQARPVIKSIIELD